jgi:hypothetical protein
LELSGVFPITGRGFVKIGNLGDTMGTRGINLASLELDVNGDLDLRGFLGVSDEVRPGYQNIQVTCRLKSDAPKEKIDELRSGRT